MLEDAIFYQANQKWDAGDVKNAFTLFTLAAEQGDPKAFNSLGYFFDNGIAVSKNSERALFWYKKAAKSGDIVAYTNIGTVYRELQNFDRARYWFMKAINSGDGDAALEMAKLYHRSKKKSDLLQVVKYLRIALKSNNITDEATDQAKALLEKIGRK